MARFAFMTHSQLSPRIPTELGCRRGNPAMPGVIPRSPVERGCQGVGLGRRGVVKRSLSMVIAMVVVMWWVGVSRQLGRV